MKAKTSIQKVKAKRRLLPHFVEPSSLKDAANQIINLGHNLCEHAYIIGKILIWTKKKVGHGDFESWVNEKVWFEIRTAQRYMKFAKKCDEADLLLEYSLNQKRLKDVFEKIPHFKLKAKIFHQNYQVFLKRQKPKCDLLLTDPPYSTEFKPQKGFMKFVNNWLPMALAKVKTTGRAYICVGAYPHEINSYLNCFYEAHCKHMTLEQILVWTYENTIGPHPKQKYMLNWQAVLYFKGVNAKPLNCPELVELFSVQRINAPDARQVPKYGTWEKPVNLAEQFIRHSTEEGDLIYDPFAGTGSFLVAAAGLGRKAIGCDSDKKMVKIARRRNCI